MKTGVIVHGCNLQIENWRHVAWGDPPDHMGRIPQGMLVAHELDAEIIVFGTGASGKPFQFGDDPEDELPLREAEYSLKYLQEYFDQLASFAPLHEKLGAVGSPEFELARGNLLRRIVLDVESQNTIQEIENAATIFLEHGMEEVVLVSSPSHVVRCLRDAAALFAEQPRFHGLRHRIMAVPSITCYEGSTPGDVVVIEPPHRPDRHVLPTHRRIQRMLELQQMPNAEVVSLIEDFDDLLQRYEHRFFGDGQA